MSEKDTFVQRVKDIHRIGSIQGHLGWDQETLMPEKGAKSRGEIMAWLAALAHERVIDPEMGDLLNQVENRSDLDEAEQANTREFRKRYDKATKLSSDFVSTFAQARSEALVAWQGARYDSDFSAFLPHLETLVALTREKILAAASSKFICIIDDTKLVPFLGKFPLPIEVIPMARSFVSREMIKLKGQPIWRENFLTDNGNEIIDVHNLKITNPSELEATINQITGVVSVGIFAKRSADILLVANNDGVKEINK